MKPQTLYNLEKIYIVNSFKFLSLMFYGHAMFIGNSQKEAKYFTVDFWGSEFSWYPNADAENSDPRNK